MSISRRTRRTIGAIVAATAVGLLFAGVLAFRTPGWFRTERVAANEYQSVRDDLQQAAQDFSDALMSPGTFEVHLAQQRLNRWIAMRHEIYPLIDRALPREWSDPVVVFTNEGIRLAARYAVRGASFIVSLDLGIARHDDFIDLRVVGCRVGSLPVGSGWFDSVFARPIRLDPGRAWRGSPRMEGNLRDGLRLETTGVWPNGDRIYDVQAIRTEPGVLHFKIDSLGPAHQSGRSVHSREAAGSSASSR